MWYSAQNVAESATRNEVQMKENIHPEYKEVNVRCSCGNTFKIRTTAGHDLSLDVCSSAIHSSPVSRRLLILVDVLRHLRSVSVVFQLLLLSTNLKALIAKKGRLYDSAFFISSISLKNSQYFILFKYQSSILQKIKTLFDKFLNL